MKSIPETTESSFTVAVLLALKEASQLIVLSCHCTETNSRTDAETLKVNVYTRAIKRVTQEYERFYLCEFDQYFVNDETGYYSELS